MAAKDPVLTVNVGGKRFSTRASTLKQIPYFDALMRMTMQSKGQGEDEADDAGPPSLPPDLFVDRCPKAFRAILNAVRRADIASLPADLAPELAFYGWEACAYDPFAQVQADALLRPLPLGDVTGVSRQECGNSDRMRAKVLFHSAQANTEALLLPAMPITQVRRHDGWSHVTLAVDKATMTQLQGLLNRLCQGYAVPVLLDLERLCLRIRCSHKTPVMCLRNDEWWVLGTSPKKTLIGSRLVPIVTMRVTESVFCDLRLSVHLKCALLAHWYAPAMFDAQ